MQEVKSLLMMKMYCAGCKNNRSCYVRGASGSLIQCPIFQEFFDGIYKKAQEVGDEFEK